MRATLAIDDEWRVLVNRPDVVEKLASGTGDRNTNWHVRSARAQSLASPSSTASTNSWANQSTGNPSANPLAQ